MSTEKILVTVRTYPTPSSQYVETVCTGGITENGEWRRLYPVPLRYLEGEQRYRTYDVIESDNHLPRSDTRPESRTPDTNTLKIVDHIHQWTSRCDWVHHAGSFNSIESLKEAERSIGTVLVRSINDLDFKPASDSWTPQQLEKLKQQQLFIDNNHQLEKVPWEFWLHWTDANGTPCKNRILAWEIHQTWRSWRYKYAGVMDRIRTKFMDEILSDRNDVRLFMGNYAQHPQHFAVIGIFHPPKGACNDTLWGA